MHVHASALDMVVLAAKLVIILFILRQIAARFHESKFGQALAAIVA